MQLNMKFRTSIQSLLRYWRGFILADKVNLKRKTSELIKIISNIIKMIHSHQNIEIFTKGKVGL